MKPPFYVQIKFINLDRERGYQRCMIPWWGWPFLLLDVLWTTLKKRFR